MAHAALVSLSVTINLILNHHQQSISPRFKYLITSLHEHVVFLQSLFEDFPDETHNLEERAREVASAAEDIINILLSDSLLIPTARLSGLVFDVDDLERVAFVIESIAEGVKERAREGPRGFDEGLMKIISQVQGGSSQRETIAIVGMSGMGKTTLAKNAYNNPSVVERFVIRSWVTISQDYSMRSIALELLGSMNSNSEDMMASEDELFGIVYKNLYGKRYLIVLDNVCVSEVWGRLRVFLPDNMNGSRIVLTTMHNNVATEAAPNGYIHRMSLMM